MILADAVAKGIVPANAVDHWKAVQPKGRAAAKLQPVDNGTGTANGRASVTSST
jgi:hypothetical protein